MFLSTGSRDKGLGLHDGRDHVGYAIYGKIEQFQSTVDSYI